MGRERQYDGVRVASASSIEIDFYYADTRCRERLKLEPTPSNLKRASQHRGAIIQAIERGDFDYGVTFPTSKNAAKFAKVPEAHGLTTTTYLDKWLAGQEKKLKASTWDDYRKIINNTWVPKIGKIELTALRRADIKAVVAAMVCSNKRISNVLSVLRAALDDAANDEELIEINPIAGWTYQNAEAVKADSDVDPFTRQEQDLILGQVQGQVQNLFRFAFWSGLRTSELCALDWDDIDWKRGVVKVTKALTQAAEEAEAPKTKAGRRDVKILGPALRALRDQQTITGEAGAEVFQDPNHLARWTGDQAIRKGQWIPALVRAGVRHRRLYQTRHTYASMMLSAGESPMWVAQQMGHSSWVMIARIYGKWMPDAAPEAGGKAEALFGDVDQNVDQTTLSNPIN